jgi:hypothetical protein
MFRPRRDLLILTLLAATLVAAGCGKTSSTPASTKAPLPTDTPPIALEAERRIEEGGFVYRPIPGYGVNGVDTNFFMIAPNADLKIGPTFLIIGGPTEEVQTVNEAFSSFTAFMADADFSEPRPFTLDGVSALRADLAVPVEGQDVTGRLVVARPMPKQGFLLLGFAPADRWQSETSALFEALLTSVKLFRLTSEAAQ